MSIKTYTWDQINTALLEKGVATPRIADILIQLNKTKREKETKIDQVKELLRNALKEIHAIQYFGIDDDMEDDFEYWISELTIEEIHELLER